MRRGTAYGKRVAVSSKRTRGRGSNDALESRAALFSSSATAVERDTTTDADVSDWASYDDYAEFGVPRPATPPPADASESSVRPRNEFERTIRMMERDSATGTSFAGGDDASEVPTELASHSTMEALRRPYNVDPLAMSADDSDDESLGLLGPLGGGDDDDDDDDSAEESTVFGGGRHDPRQRVVNGVVAIKKERLTNDTMRQRAKKTLELYRRNLGINAQSLAYHGTDAVLHGGIDFLRQDTSFMSKSLADARKFKRDSDAEIEWITSNMETEEERRLWTTHVLDSMKNEKHAGSALPESMDELMDKDADAIDTKLIDTTHLFKEELVRRAQDVVEVARHIKHMSDQYGFRGIILMPGFQLMRNERYHDHCTLSRPSNLRPGSGPNAALKDENARRYYGLDANDRALDTLEDDGGRVTNDDGDDDDDYVPSDYEERRAMREQVRQQKRREFFPPNLSEVVYVKGAVYLTSPDTVIAPLLIHVPDLLMGTSMYGLDATRGGKPLNEAEMTRRIASLVRLNQKWKGQPPMSQPTKNTEGKAVQSVSDLARDPDDASVRAMMFRDFSTLTEHDLYFSDMAQEKLSIADQGPSVVPMLRKIRQPSTTDVERSQLAAVSAPCETWMAWDGRQKHRAFLCQFADDLYTTPCSIGSRNCSFGVYQYFKKGTTEMRWVVVVRSFHHPSVEVLRQYCLNNVTLTVDELIRSKYYADALDRSARSRDCLAAEVAMALGLFKKTDSRLSTTVDREERDARMAAVGATGDDVGGLFYQSKQNPHPYLRLFPLVSNQANALHSVSGFEDLDASSAYYSGCTCMTTAQGGILFGKQRRLGFSLFYNDAARESVYTSESSVYTSAAGGADSRRHGSPYNDDDADASESSIYVAVSSASSATGRNETRTVRIRKKKNQRSRFLFPEYVDFEAWGSHDSAEAFPLGVPSLVKRCHLDPCDNTMWSSSDVEAMSSMVCMSGVRKYNPDLCLRRYMRFEALNPEWNALLHGLGYEDHYEAIDLIPKLLFVSSVEHERPDLREILLWEGTGGPGAFVRVPKQSPAATLLLKHRDRMILKNDERPGLFGPLWSEDQPFRRSVKSSSVYWKVSATALQFAVGLEVRNMYLSRVRELVQQMHPAYQVEFLQRFLKRAQGKEDEKKIDQQIRHMKRIVKTKK